MSQTIAPSLGGPLLMLDCSGNAVSAAVALPGGQQALHATVPQQHGQAEIIAPMVQALLIDAGMDGPGDLEGVVVCRGPGGFTGLRLSLAFALGLKAALPGLALSTISGDKAWSAILKPEPSQKIVACLDSRRKDFYWTEITANRGETRWQIGRPGVLPISNATFVGNAASLADPIRGIDQELDLKVLAGVLVEPEARELYCEKTTEPLYVRAPSISKPKDKR